MGSVIIWLVIMAPLSAFFTGLGIYAFRRKKPMWFWSGSTVKEEEISNIPAYNRANGIMWIVFSLFFWSSTVLGFVSLKIAALVMIIGCVLCVPGLPLAYNAIYKKYRSEQLG